VDYGDFLSKRKIRNYKTIFEFYVGSKMFCGQALECYVKGLSTLQLACEGNSETTSKDLVTKALRQLNIPSQHIGLGM
jgi:hypothetical protein